MREKVIFDLLLMHYTFSMEDQLESKFLLKSMLFFENWPSRPCLRKDIGLMVRTGD